ncbi:hypothetical protein ZWY2020_038755 [Hordeum vulgare]|nr:hypothetical protein ZWY2020_038755 [Hordeum vulgare]
MTHCNVELFPAASSGPLPFLRYLIYTPTYHTIHHAGKKANFCLPVPVRPAGRHARRHLLGLQRKNRADDDAVDGEVPEDPEGGGGGHQQYLVQVTKFESAERCRTWIVGKWLSPQGSSGGRRRALHFRSWCPILGFRRDCTYGTARRHAPPQGRADLAPAVLAGRRGGLHACHAGGVVHFLEGTRTTRRNGADEHSLHGVEYLKMHEELREDANIDGHTLDGTGTAEDIGGTVANGLGVENDDEAWSQPKEPCVGIRFDTLEGAIDHYNAYALQLGFNQSEYIRRNVKAG